MAKYHLSVKAVEDLAAIWNYTFDEWSERQADKYYDLLIESCKEVAEYPDFGKPYSSIANSLLGYKTGEHIIFYLVMGKNEIEVVRILHGMMDLKRHFSE